MQNKNFSELRDLLLSTPKTDKKERMIILQAMQKHKSSFHDWLFFMKNFTLLTEEEKKYLQITDHT